ncbi:cytochrome c-type biogenesis protein CcmH [Marinicella sp. W31]|uniref:cytochrome c-type biogenesis protein n=1 Tax=Marinicella sp. W31 TaxID=3023713 RepID=UPI003756633C
MMRQLFVTLILMIYLTNADAIDPFTFESAAQENLYKTLTEELRCMVCQNQNLADSDVTLARNLKQQIADFVKQGQSKDQITTFMAERYGDFILYNPPLRKDTILLWAAPAIILLMAFIILFIKIKQTKRD